MTGSRRGPEPRISRDSVLAAARRLPPERLTMRAVGRELGVTHGALYRYFPDLKSLLTALSADLAEALQPASEDLPWQDWLRETAHGIRQVALTHPEAGSPFTLPVVLPVAHQLIAAGLRVLTRTFPVQDAVLAFSLVSHFADGFARSELAAADQQPEPLLTPELEEALASIVGDGIPLLDADASFERELDIVLAGIDAALPKKKLEA